jgi:hypothetical protein
MNISNDSHLKIRGALWRNYKTARLQISVGQAYHEGHHLSETVKWVCANFDKAIVCVNDTLQRYNEHGAEEAGTAWIERNKEILNSLPDVQIIRWNHWLYHPDFPDLHADVKNRYKTDAVFRDAVDHEAMSFAVRRKPQSLGAFMERSRAYLLEECAAFRIMFRTPAADIYPGSTLLPCQIFKNEGGKGFTRVEVRRSLQSSLEEALL